MFLLESRFTIFWLQKKHGIDVIKSLPGVGKNLQDHLQARPIFKTDLSCCEYVLIVWPDMSSHWLVNYEIIQLQSRVQRCQGFAVLKLSIFH